MNDSKAGRLEGMCYNIVPTNLPSNVYTVWPEKTSCMFTMFTMFLYYSCTDYPGTVFLLLDSR